VRWHVPSRSLQYLRSLDKDAEATNGDFGHEDDGPVVEAKTREDTLRWQRC
jgi:hypothetical protein